MTENVAVIGLGRIGLPIALVSAYKGFNVIGIDKNNDLITLIRRGISPFHEPMLDVLLSKHLGLNFRPIHIDDPKLKEYLNQSEIICITVGVEPINANSINMAPLLDVINLLLSKGSIRDKTIIIRTTVPVGTCRKVKEYIENKIHLKEGKDYFLVYVPERLAEGKAIEEEMSLPKVIGAFSEEAYKRAYKYFSRIGGPIIRVSSPEVAEFVKLIDNAWRHTIFAFANEIALCAESLGINVLEAIWAANYEYPRNFIPVPGPVSGYCLTKDPLIFELSFKDIARKRSFHSLWFHASMVTSYLLDHVISLVKGKKVLIAGLSYKENIDDYRNSHGIELARRLVKKKYQVVVTDPFLNMNSYTKIPDDLANKVLAYKDIIKALKENKFDTIIFCVKHEEYHHIPSSLITPNTRVIDVWNSLKYLEGICEYIGLGRGDLIRRTMKQ